MHLFSAANFGRGEQVSIFRALPHEAVLPESDYFEVLNYEKVSKLLEETDRFAIGLCSCRHEKLHLGEKNCDVPAGKVLAVWLCGRFHDSP